MYHVNDNLRPNYQKTDVQIMGEVDHYQTTVGSIATMEARYNYTIGFSERQGEQCIEGTNINFFRLVTESDHYTELDVAIYVDGWTKCPLNENDQKVVDKLVELYRNRTLERDSPDIIDACREKLERDDFRSMMLSIEADKFSLDVEYRLEESGLSSAQFSKKRDYTNASSAQHCSRLAPHMKSHENDNCRSR